MNELTKKVFRITGKDPLNKLFSEVVVDLILAFEAKEREAELLKKEIEALKSPHLK